MLFLVVYTHEYHVDPMYVKSFLTQAFTLFNSSIIGYLSFIFLGMNKKVRTVKLFKNGRGSGVLDNDSNQVIVIITGC